MKPLPTAIAAALLAACATQGPQAITEGEEVIAVIAQEHVHERDWITGAPKPSTVVEIVDGVVCALRNDKGSWTATTGSRRSEPRTIAVQRSAQPLEVECAKEGYHTIRASLSCVSPRDRETKREKGSSAILGAGALPILAVYPPAVVLLAPQAALVGVQAAYTSSRGAEHDLCTYGAVAPFMVRSAESGVLFPGWRIVPGPSAKMSVERRPP